MSNLKSHVLKDKIKWVITSILLIVLSAGLLTVALKVNRVDKTKDIGAISYTIGTISSTTGKYTEDKKCIYTKSYYKADDIKVVVKEDSTATYVLYFYKADKTFISATTASGDEYTGTLPEDTKYVRVMINSNGEDDLTSLSMLGVANQVTVTVKK